MGQLEPAAHSRSNSHSCLQRQPPPRISKRRCCGYLQGRWLYRALAVALVLLMLCHSLACGALFCSRLVRVLDLPREVKDDIRDIYILAGANQGLESLHMAAY